MPKTFEIRFSPNPLFFGGVGKIFPPITPESSVFQNKQESYAIMIPIIIVNAFLAVVNFICVLAIFCQLAKILFPPLFFPFLCLIFEWGSDYLSMHSWPSPPIIFLLPIAIFCVALSRHFGFLFPCFARESVFCLTA